MQLAIITMQQVIILFIMIFAGFACAKAGIVQRQAKQAFSDLLVGLVVPCMIISSYLTPFDPQTLHNLFLAYGLSAILLTTGMVSLSSVRPVLPNESVLSFALPASIPILHTWDFL